MLSCPVPLLISIKGGVVSRLPRRPETVFKINDDSLISSRCELTYYAIVSTVPQYNFAIPLLSFQRWFANVKWWKCIAMSDYRKVYRNNSLFSWLNVKPWFILNHSASSIPPCNRWKTSYIVTMHQSFPIFTNKYNHNFEIVFSIFTISIHFPVFPK